MTRPQSMEKQHYGYHIFNPQINYARLNGCRFCIASRRKEYGNHVRNMSYLDMPLNYSGYQYLLWSKKHITKGNNKKNENYDQTCTICFELSSQNMIYINKCGHNFHFNCMKLWLDKHYTCPMCRTEL